MNKNEYALNHFQGLLYLSNKPDYQWIKKDLLPQDEFIKTYPLSILKVCSIKKFWEVCLDLGIVSNPFYSEEFDNEFDKKLYSICSIYLSTEGKVYCLGSLVEDVTQLFTEYNKV